MKLVAYLFAALMGYYTPSFAVDFVLEEPNMNNMVTRARDLPATVVVRHNRATNRLEVLHSNERLSGSAATVGALANARWVPVELNKPVRNELDRDTSRSSWFFSLGFNPFFYFNLGYSNPYYYYVPSYYYGGYSYSYMPYYYYGYAPYNYYFYRWY